MTGVTHWVRQALAELGSDATRKEITDYVLVKDPTLPVNQIPLAISRLRQSGLSGGMTRSKKPQANTDKSKHDH